MYVIFCYVGSLSLSLTRTRRPYPPFSNPRRRHHLHSSPSLSSFTVGDLDMLGGHDMASTCLASLLATDSSFELVRSEEEQEEQEQEE